MTYKAQKATPPYLPINESRLRTTYLSLMKRALTIQVGKRT